MVGLPRAKPRRMAGGNVIFEFSAVGNAVKVCAVDADTGFEVSIVGPVGAGEEALRRTALSKLRYMLEKRRPTPLKRGGIFA
ncbi:MAG: hypothetical protein ABJ215_13460 [Alphaproteobacteria bacterium]